MSSPHGVRAANDYRFVTRWRVRGSIERAAEILDRPLDLPRWWPEVYLSVTPAPGGQYDLHTRGRLPYTLRWRMRTTHSESPHRFGIEATGDFEGIGEWTLRQDGPFVELIYDWRVRAEKPLLRRLSFLLKPLFAWNHRWAMRRGELALQREMDRLG